MRPLSRITDDSTTATEHLTERPPRDDHRALEAPQYAPLFDFTQATQDSFFALCDGPN